MTSMEVYWWLKLDAINTCFVLMSIVGFFLTIFCSFLGICFISGYDSTPRHIPLGICLILSIPLWIFMVALTVLTPTTKEYAVIKVLPKIVNSDFAEEASGDVKQLYDVAKEYLKEQLQPKKP